MAPTVNPTLASAVAQTAPALQLQPGTVVAARVQQILEAGLTRILIAGMTLDVASKVALKTGTHLQLAVSQTPEAIELAIVGQGRSAAAALSNARASASGNENAGVLRAPLATVPSTQTVVSEHVATSTPLQPPPRAVSSDIKAMLTETVRMEAPRQASLAPLFANVAAASALTALPPDVAAKAAQLLALRPELGATLTADDIRQAFKSSGLFLEQTLKAAAPLPAINTAPRPDLKAALLVFRQVLANWSDALPETSSPAASSAIPSGTPQPRASVAPNATAALPQTLPHVHPSPLAASPPIVPGHGLPGTVGPAGNTAGGAALSPDADPLSSFLLTAGVAAQPFGAPLQPSPQADLSGADLPQPPFRGAAPSAQPIAQPTVTAALPQAEIAGTLLRDVDAALSRQTLHQIASLPDRVDLTLPRADTNTPRWSFEIPFATPQGTAVAQFEIIGEGGGNSEKESLRDRVWRVRFSLDVEPAGAVHASIAMVSRSDDAPPRTSVRLWAERPQTAARLKSASDDLSQALRRAELEPGSIVIADGAPPNTNESRVARAGRFVDRAS